MDPYLNHEYEENPERPGTVKRFFFACAGAYLRILEATPSEHAKYVGIGATIFLTGCMAVISGTFALYTLVPNLLVAIPGGLLWGALIFNLDRYIVSSIRKEGRFWYEFGLALPRLGLAVLISFVITKPIEVELFTNQIGSELFAYVTELEKEAAQDLDRKLGLDELDREIAALDSTRQQFKEQKISRPSSFDYEEISSEYQVVKQRFDSLKGLYGPRIQRNQSAINRLWRQHSYRETDEEGNPIGRTVLPAQYQQRSSALYRSMKDMEGILAEAEADLVALEEERSGARQEFSASLQEELTLLQEKRASLMARRAEKEALRKEEMPAALEKARKYGVGFPAKIQALERLKEKDESMWWMSNLIVALFMMLETSPVFVKLITKRGPYDYLLSRIEHHRKIESLRQISDMNYDLNATMRLRSRQAGMNGTPREGEPVSEN